MDKKSQHVGNHGGAYTDQNGMSKQFTYIDHDVKLKMATGKISPEELEDIKQQLAAHRIYVQDWILSTPASICPSVYQDFTLRGKGKDKIEWNETMIRNDGLSMDELHGLKVLLENTMELKGITI